MKPFNLEEAKAGKPFTHVNDSMKRPYHFVGVSTTGRVVVEGRYRARFLDYDLEDLCMITEKKTFKVYLLRNKESGVVFATEGHPGPNYEILGEHIFEWEE